MALALTSGRRVQCALDRTALPAGVARLLARWQAHLAVALALALTLALALALALTLTLSLTLIRREAWSGWPGGRPPRPLAGEG